MTTENEESPRDGETRAVETTIYQEQHGATVCSTCGVLPDDTDLTDHLEWHRAIRASNPEGRLCS